LSGSTNSTEHVYDSASNTLTLTGAEDDLSTEVSELVHFPVQFAVPTPDETRSEWENDALRQQDADPYHDRVDAFWRTMITNQIWDDAASKYVEAPEHTGLEYVRWTRQTDLENTLDARAKAPILDFYDFVANLMVGNGAHFFRSKGAYIGLGCKHVQSQHKIVVFHGTHLLCIPREVKHEPGTGEVATPSWTTFSTYRLIGGQIYVHAIMDGEAVGSARQLQLEAQQFP
jgi:hypothetical protein